MDAAIVAEAYRTATPLRMRNTHKGRPTRGTIKNSGQRALHRLITSPKTLHDVSYVTGSPGIQYGKASNVRGREMLLADGDGSEVNELHMSMDIIETLHPTQSPSKYQPSSSHIETGGIAGDISPTKSPKSPLPVTITVGADARLELIGMYAIMDAEATAVFEYSCGSFLGEIFAGAKLQIHDVRCDVTDQVLLSQRRLGKQGIRRNLEEENSMLVDFTVMGRADSGPNDYDVMNVSDAAFADLVHELSTVHSLGFVVHLKVDGYEAGIDDFERLTSINYISNHDSTRIDRHYDSASKSDIGIDGKGRKVKVIAISSGLAVGVLIIGMFLTYYVVKRKRASSKLSDIMDNENQLDESFEQQSATSSFDGVAPKNEQLTEMYSVDNDELGTTSDIVSIAADSIMSAVDKVEHLFEKFITPATKRIRVDIVAPPGKLGINIVTSSEGPIVHSVTPASPLDGLVFKGDLVIAVDGEDTREWSAHFLTKLLVSA